MVLTKGHARCRKEKSWQRLPLVKHGIVSAQRERLQAVHFAARRAAQQAARAAESGAPRGGGR